jgi:hypothetical protein
MAAKLTLDAVTQRLAVLRARRRRIGWFDFSPWSWDICTTVARASRVAHRPSPCRHPPAPRMRPQRQTAALERVPRLTEIFRQNV